MIAGATHKQERGLGEIYPGIATLERSGIKTVIMATIMIKATTMTMTMTTETGIRPHLFARLPGHTSRQMAAGPVYP